MNASPTKRRALASLDVNAPSPNTQHTLAKQGIASPVKHTTEPESKKRLLLPMAAAAAEQPPSKKTCLAPPTTMTTGPEPESIEPASSGRDAGVASEEEHQHHQDRGVSASPAPSSVFDSSGIDTSQATNMTELDVDAITTAALPAPRPRRIPTREESRQKAEILRLRLSLAQYKLRTGQADVPLEQLQVRPLPGAAPAPRRRRTPLPSGPVRPSSSSGSATATTAAAPSLRRQDSYGSVASSSAPSTEADDDESSEKEMDARKQQKQQVHRSPEKDGLLPVPSASSSSLLTPRRGGVDIEADDRLTSSALRGGAANGLLRLSLARV